MVINSETYNSLCKVLSHKWNIYIKLGHKDCIVSPKNLGLDICVLEV